MNDRPGRNDPCPCGSGRKFKHCCLRASAAAIAGRSIAAAPPSSADAHYNHGIELQQKGRLAEALASYRAALAVRPGFFEAHVNLANVLQDLGDADVALAHLRDAIALRPQAMDLYLNIGAVLHTQGRYREAADIYRQAMQRSGPDVRWFNNLGMALREARQLDEAAAAFRAGLSLAPDSADLMEGLASVLQAGGQLSQAAKLLRETIALQPATARLHLSLGGALLSCGRVDEALPWYRSAVRLEPWNATAHSCLLFAQQYSDKVSLEEHFAGHQSYAERFESPLLPFCAANLVDVRASRRLRIGYVSADLRSHSVARFVEPLLECHDRTQFEVTCYFVDKRADAVTARLRALCDRWRDCAADDDLHLARRIRDDGIDILVDLSGHTGGHRLGVFARRPAPLQLSWIGYPFASGLQRIDFRISDPVASPLTDSCKQEDAKETRQETLIRLPRIFCCYRPAANPPMVPTTQFGAKTCVVASFNNCAKISDSTVQLWGRVLRERADVILLLKDKAFIDADVRSWMAARFAAQGIAEDRIELLGRLASDEEHLAMYARVDVALDTYPYNGVTTTCEALWMGVPVVSLTGNSFASRMGATLLTAIGFPQWATSDPDQYVACVLGLLDDNGARAALRCSLRDRMRGSPLLDEVGVTREFEAKVLEAWKRICGDASFTVIAQAEPSPVH